MHGQKIVFGILGFLLFFPVLSCYSEEDHSTSHAHHSHHKSGIEYGVSIEYSYLDEKKDEHSGEGVEEQSQDSEHEIHNESQFVPGLHLHIIKQLAKEGFLKYLGAGVGGELLFTRDTHYSLMGSLAFYPWRELVLILSPGAEFAKHEGNKETALVMHYEAAYGFMVNDFHIGPAIGFAQTGDSQHYSLGIHIGF